MGFSRQEYWSVLPGPTPGDLPDGRDQDHPHGKEMQKNKMAVWGGWYLRRGWGIMSIHKLRSNWNTHSLQPLKMAKPDMKMAMTGRQEERPLSGQLLGEDSVSGQPSSLVKAMVFPVVMYGCECWTVKKAERRRIDAFELWCCRRLLRLPWMEWVAISFSRGSFQPRN